MGNQLPAAGRCDETFPDCEPFAELQDLAIRHKIGGSGQTQEVDVEIGGDRHADGADLGQHGKPDTDIRQSEHGRARNGRAGAQMVLAMVEAQLGTHRPRLKHGEITRRCDLRKFSRQKGLNLGHAHLCHAKPPIDFSNGLWQKAPMDHDQYPDELIRGILNSVKTIALVGASSNEVRPSYFVLKYLSQRGYRIIGVNPGLAGQEVLGCPFYAKLSDIPEPLDMVEIFRNSEAASGIVDEALALDPLPKVIWMQLTVRNDEAAERAEAKGITVIMNRCPKIEYGRLSGEIGWTGVNSRIISSKRQIMSGKGFQKRTIAPGANPFGTKK